MQRTGPTTTRMISIAALALCAVLVQGCASTPPRTAQGAPTVAYSFTVDQDYLAVFSRVLTRARACMPSVGFSRTRVDGVIQETTRSADIAVAQEGIAGVRTQMSIGIAAQQGATRVSVTNRFNSWDAHARAVERWAIDGSAPCTAAAVQ